ncbi:MAG TPA: deoxyuridine 5'-triphosphate nucleotidohydrolase [Candidatus Methylomirabilis sp.]|nr:deoxyuridine 5'-triphosphate nucleotidohydrolase [Candidatus Methylomirabilis sp.]
MLVRITKLDPRAVVPQYQTAGAAAFDLHVIEDAVIEPGGTAFLRTGLVFGIPADHVMLIFPRSSMYTKTGLRLGNQTGILDADYCGPNDECLIYVWNPGDTAVDVKVGTRLAQAIVLKRDRVTFEEGPALGPSRGGWGTTG